jgi:hydroxymethylbilane synthase
VKRLIIGTRGSALALAQVDLTEAALAKAWPGLKVERQIFVTRGDKKLDLNLLEKGDAGGKGLEIASVLERAPIADMLVGKSDGGFDALPRGAKVGTSSIRRAKQLAWLRPDIQIEEWRGNVPTRLRKLGEREDIHAIVLAEAGLRRLGYKLENGRLIWEGGEWFAASLIDKIIPAIGQGVVALQASSSRPEVLEVLHAINHPQTMLAVRAEREVQRLIAGDCSVPVGVRTELYNGTIKLHGILFKESKRQTAVVSGDEPEGVAKQLARQLTQ